MAVLSWVLVIVSFIILIVFIVWQINWKKNADKVHIPINAPIVENLTRVKFTDGYSIGSLMKDLPRKNGTRYIEYFPWDVEQGEDVKRPRPQSLIVKKELVRAIPQGNLSSRRQMIKLISRNPLDYPEEMRNELEGEWGIKKSHIEHLKKTFEPALEGGDDAIAEIMKYYSRGQATDIIIKKMEEQNEKMQDLLIAKEKSKIGSSQDEDKH